MQIVSAVGFVVTFLALGLALVMVRVESKIRSLVDLIRLGGLIATIIVLSLINPDRISPAPVGLAVFAGLVLGLAQGNGLVIRLAANNTMYVRRNRLGLATWGAGILVVQAAGVARRADLVDVGLAVTAFGVASGLGLLIGRTQRVRAARRAVAPALVCTVLLLGTLGGLGAGPLDRAYASPAAVEPPAEVPQCPSGIGSVNADEFSNTRVSEHDSDVPGLPYYLVSVDCTFAPEPGDDDFSEAGRFSIKVFWTVGPDFNSCVEGGVFEENQPGGGSDYFHQFESGTHNISASIQGRDGTRVNYAQAKGAVDSIMAQAEATADPCGQPEWLTEDAPVACPDSIGVFNRSSSLLSEYEGLRWFSCSYHNPYPASVPGGGTIQVTWYDDAADVDQREGCGQPPEDDSSSAISKIHSRTEHASVSINVEQGAPYRADFVQVAETLLAEIEGRAATCAGVAGGGGAGEDDPGTDTPAGDPTTADGTDSSVDEALSGGSEDSPTAEEDELSDEDAVANALAGAAAAVLAAGIGLVQNGWSAGQVIDLLNSGGPGALTQAASTRTSTIYLGGEEAEDYLDRLTASTDPDSPSYGQPVDIAVPEDQQWEVWVSAGDQLERGGRLGAVGTPHGEPVIVRGEDGSVSVAIDVDFPGAAPPPPSPDADIGSQRAPLPDGPASPAVAPPDPPPAVAPPDPPPSGDMFTEDELGDATLDWLERSPDADVVTGADPAVVAAPDVPDADPAAEAPAAEIEPDDAAPEPPPEVTPEMIQGMRDDFEEVVAAQDDVHWVRNPNLGAKAVNNFPLNPWAYSSYGGQCGEFGEWGQQWSEHMVKDRFGEAAIVDTIEIEEKSSVDPAGLERLDALVTVNHRATRVILPNGERYVLDYWERMGRNENPAVVPETEWIERWRPVVGAEDHVINRSADENLLARYVRERGEEEGFEIFRRAAADKGQAETVINSWQRDPW